MTSKDVPKSYLLKGRLQMQIAVKENWNHGIVTERIILMTTLLSIWMIFMNLKQVEKIFQWMNTYSEIVTHQLGEEKLKNIWTYISVEQIKKGSVSSQQNLLLTVLDIHLLVFCLHKVTQKLILENWLVTIL